MYRIFIGWDSRFPEPAKVLEYTLRKHASKHLDIRFLDLKHLAACHDFHRVHDPLASTEFTYSRFLVPYLCDYDGPALFLDNDMVCLGDVCPLFDGVLPVFGKALHVVKHEHTVVDGSTKMYGATQTAYPRKNWSSFMLMNCSKLKCWTKELVETASGARLHRFEDVPDHMIGSLPKRWNSLDGMDVNTQFIHWTSGGPWYEEYANCPHADVWYEARAAYEVDACVNGGMFGRDELKHTIMDMTGGSLDLAKFRVNSATLAKLAWTCRKVGTGVPADLTRPEARLFGGAIEVDDTITGQPGFVVEAKR